MTMTSVLGPTGWTVGLVIPPMDPSLLVGILGDDPPDGELTVPTPGDNLKASRDDHQHPRLTSATSHVTDGSGQATCMFTRSFATAPKLAPCYAEAADSEPVIMKRVSWVMDGPNYVGCVMKAYRLRTLPASIALLSVLISFSVSGGSAAGIAFDLIALQSS